MIRSRHRCLVAVNPRLLGDALARLLPGDRFEVVVVAEEIPAGIERYDVVIASSDVEPPAADVVVRLEGDELGVAIASGPGPRVRRLHGVAEIVAFVTELGGTLDVAPA